MNHRRIPAFSRLTMVLLGFAILNLVGMNLFLVTGLGAKLGDLSLSHTLAFIRIDQHFGDSWGAMMAAYSFLKSGAPGSVYQEVFFNQQVKFQYPLSSLLIFPLLEAFSGDHQDWLRSLKYVSWGFVCLTLMATLMIFRIAKREAGLREGKADGWAQGALLLALALTYYPVLKAFSLGQIQVWINAFFALALLLLISGKHAAAGALCGLMCLIKPQYALFMVWGLLRKQIAFTRACFAVLMSGLALSIVTFGPQHMLDYVRVTSFLSRHGEGFYPNQSVNGLLNRFFQNGNNVDWVANGFPPFHPGIYAATLATSVLLIVIGLTWKHRPATQARWVDFCMLALVCTMASPIAWEHHYGVLLPIFALAYPLCHKPSSGGRWLAPCLGLSYLLSSHFVFATTRLADSWLNPAQSYLFFGACLLLLCLWRLRRGEVPSNETVGFDSRITSRTPAI